MEEIGHICEKCGEPQRNALNNLVRLKSLSEELMDHLLAELNKKSYSMKPCVRYMARYMAVRGINGP